MGARLPVAPSVFVGLGAVAPVIRIGLISAVPADFGLDFGLRHPESFRSFLTVPRNYRHGLDREATSDTPNGRHPFRGDARCLARPNSRGNACQTVANRLIAVRVVSSRAS